jgi:transcriptional regulator with XRE-family HTH domain
MVKESSIPKRMKELRVRRGLNQAALARISNITPAAISQIESGERNPSLEIAQRIVRALNVSIDYFVGSSEIENEYAILLEWKEFYETFINLEQRDRELLIKQSQYMKEISSKE